MKAFKQHILEKLKVSSAQSKITSKQFFDVVFKYCQRNDTPEIIAQNIYEKFDNIPEICIDPDVPNCRVNFALRPQGRNKIVDLEIWEYNLKNKPIGMIVFVKADDHGFNFLKTEVFDEETIVDIYNYCV